ncbi:hypothetical protein V5799_007667 [Amblyomma americanum]|uniref:AAA+ ATPase domain-containing protein n=1 Tax=Amblyomma americanum TaxID=6943 RepID=A0AAQ4FHB2_AMBAM
MMNWVKPEDGFCLEPPAGQSTRSRMRRKRPAAKQNDCSATYDGGTSEQNLAESAVLTDGTWVEKFAPKTRNDLAVHRDKVEQVSRCIAEKLSSGNKNAGAIVLLSGPAGSGKTATLRCLAAEQGFTICEWVNPVSLTARAEYNQNWDFGGVTGQVEQFEDFLFQSSRYPSLLSEDSAKRIVLVEDLPNIFIRDPGSLRMTLRTCCRVSIAPLVFIISDSADQLEHRLFPEDFLRELEVTKIAFNPIATTFVAKALCALLDRAAQSQTITHEPTPDDIDSIVAASNGDIRSAINALEFFCSPSQTSPLQHGSGAVPPRNDERKSVKSDTYGSGIGRDAPLTLFHSLGKILHCKPKQTEQTSKIEGGSQASSADLSLATTKDPEKHTTGGRNPEDVFERSGVSGELFALFLHHNMPDFAADVYTVAECCEWFCHGDVLFSEWTSENVMETHAVSVITRGLMSSLAQSTTKSAGWKPLGKPQWSGALRDIKQKLYDLRVSFKGQHSTGRELQLDRVPYLALLRGSSTELSNSQRLLVDEIGVLANRNPLRFSANTSWSSLREQDMVDDRQVELSVNYTCKNVEALPDAPCYSDEEIVIEEFDD